MNRSMKSKKSKFLTLLPPIMTIYQRSYGMGVFIILHKMYEIIHTSVALAFSWQILIKLTHLVRLRD